MHKLILNKQKINYFKLNFLLENLQYNLLFHDDGWEKCDYFSNVRKVMNKSRTAMS